MTSRPYKLGLTGSIGMGKSTTAAFFADAGVPVWDADECVHRLYAKGGAGVPAIALLAPGAVADGAVDRAKLRDAIAADAALLPRIEAAIHPLVAADRERFVNERSGAGDRLVVFDVPLLFETGADAWLDGVLVVTAPPEVQRDRVLSRAGMTEAQLARIRARQMPDSEKRSRADFVIDTSAGLEAARSDVLKLIRQICGGRDA
ncbi:MAG: dephospho-CoA kinase [Paracoccaceae bacterium]